MRIKYASMLLSVPLIAMLLFTSSVQATVITRYAPYGFSSMTTKREGLLKDGYALIHRAETNPNIGRMYVDMEAKSVVYIAHTTEVNFEMGNTYPYQSVWADDNDDISVTIKIVWKGSFVGKGNTGYARITVKIKLINYWGGTSDTRTVYNYISVDGAEYMLGTQYYSVTFNTQNEGHYGAHVLIYTKCYSGNSGQAYVDFGSENQYIDLEWIRYSITAGYPDYPPGQCPILSVYNGEEYVEEGTLNLGSQIKKDPGKDNIFFHTLTTTPVPEQGKYLLRLTEPDLPDTHSYIDQVRLLSIDKLDELQELRLISAIHSEQGNVLPTLLFSDDRRTDTLAYQTIDLKFLIPQNEAEVLIFIIEGNNNK